MNFIEPEVLAKAKKCAMIKLVRKVIIVSSILTGITCLIFWPLVFNPSYMGAWVGILGLIVIALVLFGIFGVIVYNALRDSYDIYYQKCIKPLISEEDYLRLYPPNKDCEQPMW